ncbi:hypothetical protein SARC_11915, partial [Sphaeroforma arctica JP610]
VQNSDEEISPTVFKNPSYKRIRDKPLKQIISQERNASFPPSTALFVSIDAPPSLKPPYKYSDSSGLLAYYVDPRTRIRFNNKEEYAKIAEMPEDVIKGYLALRNAVDSMQL